MVPDGKVTVMAKDIADVLVPEWIKEISEERTREARECNGSARDSALADTPLKSSVPTAVRGILKELALQCLASTTIGVQATMNDVSRKTDTEAHQQVFRIQVTAGSPWVKTTYADVSYAEGEPCIHCCPRDSDPFNIKLAPDERGNLIIISPNGPLPTPELAARFILRPAVKYVLGR